MEAVTIGIPVLQNIVNAMDHIAPFSTAEDWDNVGILAGHPDRPVRSILLALDLCNSVLDEAKNLGVDAIITHHPILFHGTKNMNESDPEIKVLCGLVRSEIGLIASHTCLDRAEHGVAYSLATCLNLQNTRRISGGFALIGTIERQSCASFAAKVKERLGVSDIRKYGFEKQYVTVCTAAPGSGGSFWREARNAGADCFITGEISYHDALSAVENGMCVFEVGHFFSERPVLKSLARDLQNEFDMLQYSCRIYISENTPYGL